MPIKEYLTREINEVIRRIRDRDPIQNDIPFRLSVLVYQIGDLAKSYAYAKIFGLSSTEAKRVYAQEMKKALSDAYIQLIFTAQVLGINEMDMGEMGLDGLKEFESRFARKEGEPFKASAETTPNGSERSSSE